MEKQLPQHIIEKLLEYQKNEITEHYVYKRLARKTKSSKNSKVLDTIAVEELAHYKLFEKYTKKQVKPNKFKIWWYGLLASIFGLTFAVKLMERGEEDSQTFYNQIKGYVPEAEKVIKDEYEHERQLIDLMDEEMLNYMGSVVLGLNDALVELTGALAGFTLALQNTRLIAILGAITGFAAALSMAASEYLSTKAEGEGREPFKASFYTGIAYLFTVFVLILPYIFLSNYYIALGLALIAAIIIIAIFNYFLAVVKDLKFGKQFLEMVIISLSVSALSFLIGLAVRKIFGIDV